MRKGAWFAGLLLFLGGCSGRVAGSFTVQLSSARSVLVTPDEEKLADIIGYAPERFEEDVRRVIAEACA